MLLPCRIRRGYLCILVLIVAGAFLRIYDLGSESFWRDETVSLYTAQSDLHSIANPPHWDAHVLPLYYLMLHFWIRLAGSSEFGVRLLSALLGILCIPVLYVLGRVLFDSEEVGLWGALILSFSMFHVRFSQEARMYSLLTLFALVSMYFFVRVLRENRAKLWICYGLSSVLLVYSHVYGCFVVLLQVILFALWRPEQGKERSGRLIQKGLLGKGLLVATCVFLAFLPWFLRIFESTSGTLKPPTLVWLPGPNLIFIVATFFVFASGSLIGFLLLSWFGKEGIWTGMESPMRQLRDSLGRFSPSSMGVYVCLFWLWLPILVAFLVSVIHTPIFHPKYLILASPALFLLAGKGLSRRKGIVRTLLVLVVVLDGVGSIASHYAHEVNERWREVAVFMEDRAEADELIFISPPWHMQTFQHYYEGPGVVKDLYEPCRNDTVFEGTAWLVLSTRDYTATDGLDDDCQFIFVEEFPSLDVLGTLTILGYPIYNVVSPKLTIYHT